MSGVFLGAAALDPVSKYTLATCVILSDAVCTSARWECDFDGFMFQFL